MFTGGKSKRAARAVETAVQTTRPYSKTVSTFDAATGVTTDLRTFEYNGSIYLARSESRIGANGERICTTKIIPQERDGSFVMDGFVSAGRTKTISVTEGNILGGKTIKVESEYRGLFDRNLELTREYDANHVLQHKELKIDYINQSGYKIRATEDREAVDLVPGYQNMLENPLANLTSKHTLSKTPGDAMGDMTFRTVSNHGNFASEGTPITRAIAAKTAQEEAVVKSAREAEEASALAAAKTAEELAARRPRINVGKALGLNVEDLKVVEEVSANGAITRSYFRPGVNIEEAQPVIRTYDHGLLHKEWIYNGKQDFIYMKQLGKDDPYIVAKSGDITQVQYRSPEQGSVEFPSGHKHYDPMHGQLVHRQYFSDGENSMRIMPTSYQADGGRVWGKFWGFKPNEPVSANNPEYVRYSVLDGQVARGQTYRTISEAEKEVNGFIKNVEEDAKRKYLNLDDLFAPYKA